MGACIRRFIRRCHRYICLKRSTGISDPVAYGADSDGERLLTSSPLLVKRSSLENTGMMCPPSSNNRSVDSQPRMSTIDMRCSSFRNAKTTTAHHCTALLYDKIAPMSIVL